MRTSKTRFEILALTITAIATAVVVFRCQVASQAQDRMPEPATLAPERAALAIEKAPSSSPAPEAPIAQATASWDTSVEATARLVTNEAGLLRSRHPGIDGALIASILQRFRGELESVAEYVARNHHRHTRPNRTDSNRWVADLSVSLERPIGWPERSVPWATDARGLPGWIGRLEEAEANLSGLSELECPAAFPVSWGGPVTDHALLMARLESGRYRIVAGPRIAGELPGWRIESEQCSVGDERGSRNVYLARARELDR